MFGTYRNWKLSLVIGWATFVLVITPILGLTLYQSIRYDIASRREVITTGQITRYHPEDHARYDYVFRVDARPYIGRDAVIPYVEPGAAVGRKVPVYYDPVDPGTNALFSLKTRVAYLPLILLWAAVLAYLLWLMRRHRREIRAEEP